MVDVGPGLPGLPGPWSWPVPIPGPAEAVDGGADQAKDDKETRPSSRMEAGGWTATRWLAGGSQIVPMSDKGRACSQLLAIVRARCEV